MNEAGVCEAAPAPAFSVDLIDYGACGGGDIARRVPNSETTPKPTSDVKDTSGSNTDLIVAHQQQAVTAATSVEAVSAAEDVKTETLLTLPGSHHSATMAAYAAVGQSPPFMPLITSPEGSMTMNSLGTRTPAKCSPTPFDAQQLNGAQQHQQQIAGTWTATWASDPAGQYRGDQPSNSATDTIGTNRAPATSSSAPTAAQLQASAQLQMQHMHMYQQMQTAVQVQLQQQQLSWQSPQQHLSWQQPLLTDRQTPPQKSHPGRWTGVSPDLQGGLPFTSVLGDGLSDHPPLTIETSDLDPVGAAWNGDPVPGIYSGRTPGMQLISPGSGRDIPGIIDPESTDIVAGCGGGASVSVGVGWAQGLGDTSLPGHLNFGIGGFVGAGSVGGMVSSVGGTPFPTEPNQDPTQATARSTSGGTGIKVKRGAKPKGGGKYACEVCGKSFSQSGNLNRHKVVHSRIRPFQCDICGKGFSQKGHVRTHQTVHTGVKAYQCHICEKKFSQLGHLNGHIDRHGIGQQKRAKGDRVSQAKPTNVTKTDPQQITNSQDFVAQEEQPTQKISKPVGREEGVADTTEVNLLLSGRKDNQVNSGQETLK